MNSFFCYSQPMIVILIIRGLHWEIVKSGIIFKKRPRKNNQNHNESILYWSLRETYLESIFLFFILRSRNLFISHIRSLFDRWREYLEWRDGCPYRALYYFCSGGHFNPAVSLAGALTGHLPPIHLPFYVVSQLVGGICGSLLTRVWCV